MSGFEDLDDEEIDQLREIHETHDKIIELRKNGKSYNEIAKIIGWSLETIKVFLGTNQFSPDHKKRNKKLT